MMAGMAAVLLDSRLPLVAAPMAGGPTTIALARAVAAAGAFPFLAGGYKDPAALAAQITELRAALAADGSAPGFGVNLFVPQAPPPDASAIAAYAERLRTDADALGVRLDPAPVHDDDAWRAKLDLLLRDPVPVVSLTLGLPDGADIAALRQVGTRVLATVTSADEALAARAVGVDGLVVQGGGAGGHSAIHDPARDPLDGPTARLVATVREAVDLPLIAAGGVDGPAAVRELLDAGAQAVAIGTLLLRTHEAGTSPTHRAALADPALTETVLTRAFTGRPARALRTSFIDRHGAAAPTAYPAIHHLTRELRAAAGAAGDAQRLHLWAGTGWRAAREEPAARAIERLAAGV